MMINKDSNKDSEGAMNNLVIGLRMMMTSLMMITLGMVIIDDDSLGNGYH